MSRFILCCAVLGRAGLHCVVLCLCCVVLCCVVLCCVVLCCVVLCCVVLCCVVLCCVVLCCVVKDLSEMTAEIYMRNGTLPRDLLTPSVADS